jgi:hypothetical protein
LLKEALIKSFDELRTNGNLLIPFVVSLSNHGRNQLNQSFLKPRKKDQRGGTAPQDIGELYRNRQHDPRRKFERKPLPGVEETMSGAGLEPDHAGAMACNHSHWKLPLLAYLRYDKTGESS